MGDLIITRTPAGVDLTDSEDGAVTINGATPGGSLVMDATAPAGPGVPTSLVRKVEVFDGDGVSLGFIPIYRNL